MKKKSSLSARIFLTLFVVLILSGVAVKRLAGHPEFVIFFHLPAAVVLVVWAMEFKKRNEAEYREEIDLVRNRMKRGLRSRG